MARDTLPGTSNVVRFPIEERARPTLDLLREIAPDVRGVEMTAEAFHLPVPDPDFRHQVDAEAAEHILNNIDPRPGEERNMALRALRDRVVAAAVAAARVWRRASVAAEEARGRVAQARAEGGYWIEVLEQRRDALEHEAAILLLEAHMRGEEAEGVARAVHLARSGQAWAPFDLRREAEALFFGAEKRSA
jgi:hypothetical protein